MSFRIFPKLGFKGGVRNDTVKAKENSSSNLDKSVNAGDNSTASGRDVKVKHGDKQTNINSNANGDNSIASGKSTKIKNHGNNVKIKNLTVIDMSGHGNTRIDSNFASSNTSIGDLLSGRKDF